jgi:hypothetical protein
MVNTVSSMNLKGDFRLVCAAKGKYAHMYFKPLAVSLKKVGVKKDIRPGLRALADRRGGGKRRRRQMSIQRAPDASTFQFLIEY